MQSLGRRKIITCASLLHAASRARHRDKVLASDLRNDAEPSRTLPDTGSRHGVRISLMQFAAPRSISRRPRVQGVYSALADHEGAAVHSAHQGPLSQILDPE